MTILLYIVDSLFALMALGLISTFWLSKRPGILLAALVYGVAAITSFQLVAWWPLGVGFAAAWLLRFLGLDPCGS